LPVEQPAQQPAEQEEGALSDQQVLEMAEPLPP